MARSKSLISIVKGIIRSDNYSRKQFQKAADLLAAAAAGGPCCPIIDGIEIPFQLTGDNPSHCNIIVTNDLDVPDNDPDFRHYLQFIGQEGQGNFFVEIPIQAFNAGIREYQAQASGTVIVPSGLSGMYVVAVAMTTSSDYPGVEIRNASNVMIASALSGNLIGVSSPFDITEMKSINFTSTCGG